MGEVLPIPVERCNRYNGCQTTKIVQKGWVRYDQGCTILIFLVLYVVL